MWTSPSDPLGRACSCQAWCCRWSSSCQNAFPSKPLKCHFAITMACSIPALPHSGFRHTYAFSIARSNCALRRSLLSSIFVRGSILKKTLQALPMVRRNSGNERVKFLCFLLDVSGQMVLWVDGWGSFRQLRLKWWMCFKIWKRVAVKWSWKISSGGLSHVDKLPGSCLLTLPVTDSWGYGW